MKKMLIAAAALTLLPLFGIGLKVDVDGRTDKISMTSADGEGFIKGVTAKWAKEQANCYLIYTASAGNEEKSFKLQFTPDKSGNVNLCFRSDYYNTTIAKWIAYSDIKITGAKLLNVDLKAVKNGAPAEWRSGNRSNVGFIIGENGKNALAGSHNAYWYQPVSVTAGTPVTVEFTARFDRETPGQSYHSVNK